MKLSGGAKTDNASNIRYTHALIDTRRYSANTCLFDSSYSTQQLRTDKTSANYYIMNNNNENNQNDRFFRVEGQLTYNWGADNEIMSFINTREKSSEPTELVSRRIDQTSEITSNETDVE